MLKPCFIAWIVSISMLVLGADVVFGQNYPNKIIHIVAAEPGGNADFNARIIAQGISGPLGQLVIVDNRPPNIVNEFVAKAPPDGYTLMATASNFWIGPLLRKVPYDPVRDFSPISIISTSPNVLVVHPSLPVKSVKGLIALAKARPGELTFASATIGGSVYLATELFKSMASVNILSVPYKSAGPAVNDIIGGQVQLMFGSASSVAPHIKSGRLRALAVTSAQPSALFPDLPTVAASGLPGYESTGRTGVFAPAKTPEVIIKRLNEEIVRVLNQSDVKQKFLDIGVEVVGSSPAEFAVTIKSEMARMGKVIKDAGLKAE